MEQLNKAVLVGDSRTKAGICEAMYELYKIIRRTHAEVVESDCVQSMYSTPMCSVSVNFRDWDAPVKKQQAASRYAFKFFYLGHAIGFFSVTKVNLRNAP